MNITAINEKLRNASPQEIIRWALWMAIRPVVTTNFRPYEAAILHAVTSEKSDVPVIWCDSGYNTSYTYVHAEKMTRQLNLNVDIYVPEQTAAHRDVIMGIPEPDTREHEEFTRQVKLEPFKRAMVQHRPDVWFTNLRKGQTALRDTMDIVNLGDDGVLKVCPFFYWTNEELDAYIQENGLETEDRYYDPTKAFDNRECGLHVQQN